MEPADLDFYRQQLLLQDFATWVENHSKADNYITCVINVAAMSITILWHGSESVELRGMVDEGHRRGIRVIIKRRKFSRKRLHDAARAVFDSSGTGAFSGFKIHTVAAIDPEFDGLVVGGEYLAPLDRSHADTDTALALAASAEFDIDIAIEPGNELVR